MPYSISELASIMADYSIPVEPGSYIKEMDVAQQPLAAPFVIEMALNMIGLTPQQKATVEAAIPEVQAIADIVNKNMATVNAAVALVNQVMPHLQKAMPGVQIVADAIGGQQGMMSMKVK